jgi:hypothetical protein
VENDSRFCSWLAPKKIGVIRNWIQNYIQSGIIDTVMNYYRIPKPIRTAIHLATNLDQLSVVQWTIGKLGLYKWIAYCVYFLFFA